MTIVAALFVDPTSKAMLEKIKACAGGTVTGAGVFCQNVMNKRTR